jgi:glycosyltransferase involved in cell wall biosynthesis
MNRMAFWLTGKSPVAMNESRRDGVELPRYSDVAVIGIRGIPASYGGLETCAEHTTRYWSSKKLNVLVYCRKHHYSERPAALGAVRLKYTPSVSCASLDTLSHSFVSIVDLLLTERHIKLVHLYNTGNAIFLPLLKLFGKRVVVSGDGLEWKREKWGLMARITHKLGERMAVLFADQIIVDNEEVRKYYLRKYSASTSLIAYGARIIRRNEARSAPLLARYRLEPKGYSIFVGRLVPEKGVLELIETYNKLNTEYPLVIIGDDVNRTAYRHELFSRQSEKVRFLGFLYGDDYEQLLVNAAIYVSASKLEGTSPSLLSAMGARVCSLVNGIQENQACAAGACCLFEENNYEDLRVKWQQLLDNPALIEEMAERGYRHVQANYQWDRISERYLTLFSQVR